MTSQTLQDRAQTLLAVASEVEANGGEVEPGSALAARWNEAFGALVAKVDDFVLYVQENEGRAETLEAMAKALRAKADAVRRHNARLEDYADLCIGQDRQELRGDALRIRRQLNPPKVVILDEDKLRETCPEAFAKVETWKLDKAVVKTALAREGSGVQGAMIERGHRIVMGA